jgi:hypothetical protein
LQGASEAPRPKLRETRILPNGFILASRGLQAPQNFHQRKYLEKQKKKRFNSFEYG